MKSLSKLHQEAILKAQNETDQNKAAAMAMIEKPIEMIKAIMLKHEIAVIEVMRELHESREAAVMAERQRIKREWVGLTNADKQEAFDETQEASGGFWEFADYLDAKLKEKNT